MKPASADNSKPRLIARLTVVGYALVALSLGIICIVNTPFGQSNDVWTHVYRIDSILNGGLMPHRVNSISLYHSNSSENYGGAVSWGFVTLSDNNWMFDAGHVLPASIDSYDQFTADVPFNNTAVYNPLSYAPYLATLAVANALDTPAWIAYYAMEVAGLIFYILITAIAVLYLPKYRIPLTILLLLMFLPSLIQPQVGQSADLFWVFAPFAINPDTVLFSFTTLFVCLLFRAVWLKPTNKLLIALMLAGLVVAIAKFVYLPLVLASLGLLYFYRQTKGQQTASRITRSGQFIIVVGCFFCLVITIWWMQTVNYFATSPFVLSFVEVQTKNQMLAEQPFSVIGEVLNAIIWHHSFREASGTVIFLFQIVLIAILLCAIIAKLLKVIDARQLLLFLIYIVAIFAVMFAIYLAMWLQFTSLSATSINGVQGRYFYPLFPLMLLMICSLVASLKRRFSLPAGYGGHQQSLC